MESKKNKNSGVGAFRFSIFLDFVASFWQLVYWFAKSALMRARDLTLHEVFPRAPSPPPFFFVSLFSKHLAGFKDFGGRRGHLGKHSANLCLTNTPKTRKSAPKSPKARILPRYF